MTKGIYQEVDGFYYYDPHGIHGCYSAYYLRQIADELDALNKAWSDQIDKELGKDRTMEFDGTEYNPLSNCCGAQMRVEGDETHYYVCTKCGQACDPKKGNQ